MTDRGTSFSTGYFTLSIALHSLAVVGILLAPQLELLDEGSGNSIEFVAAEAPKGEQLETPVVTEKEVVVEKPAAKAAALSKPTPVAKAETPAPTIKDLTPQHDAPLPENLDSEISAEPAEDVAASSELPDKIEDVAKAEELEGPAEDPIVEESKYDDLMAEVEEAEVEVEAAEQEANTASIAITPVVVDEPKATPEPQSEAEATPVAAVKEEPPVEETKEEENQEQPAVAAAPVPAPSEESLPDKAMAQAPAEEAPKGAATGSGTPAAATSVAQPSQSNKAYGTPSGSIRSYLDLTQVRGNRPPQYPTIARRNNQQGQVKLAYFVNSDGSVGKMKLVKSSGYPLLDKEAVRAVSQYKYTPGQAGWTLHPVNFQLQGPVKKMPSRLRTSSRTSGISNN